MASSRPWPILWATTAVDSSEKAVTGEFEKAETGTILERVRLGHFAKLSDRILYQVEPGAR